MSVHYEDITAHAAAVSLARRGWVGETQVTDCALVISGDSVVAVYGTPMELIRFAERVLGEAVKALTSD